MRGANEMEVRRRTRTNLLQHNIFDKLSFVLYLWVRVTCIQRDLWEVKIMAVFDSNSDMEHVFVYVIDEKSETICCCSV